MVPCVGETVIHGLLVSIVKSISPLRVFVNSIEDDDVAVFSWISDGVASGKFFCKEKSLCAVWDATTVTTFESATYPSLLTYTI